MMRINCEKTSHHKIIHTKDIAISGREAIHAHQKQVISHRKASQTIRLHKTHACFFKVIKPIRKTIQNLSKSSSICKHNPIITFIIFSVHLQDNFSCAAELLSSRSRSKVQKWFRQHKITKEIQLNITTEGGTMGGGDVHIIEIHVFLPSHICPHLHRDKQPFHPYLPSYTWTSLLMNNHSICICCTTSSPKKNSATKPKKKLEKTKKMRDPMVT